LCGVLICGWALGSGVRQPPNMTLTFVRPSDGVTVVAYAGDETAVSLFVGKPTVLSVQVRRRHQWGVLRARARACVRACVGAYVRLGPVSGCAAIGRGRKAAPEVPRGDAAACSHVRGWRGMLRRRLGRSLQCAGCAVVRRGGFAQVRGDEG
jgi:hypothetical protein